MSVARRYNSISTSRILCPPPRIAYPRTHRGQYVSAFHVTTSRGAEDAVTDAVLKRKRGRPRKVVLSLDGLPGMLEANQREPVSTTKNDLDDLQQGPVSDNLPQGLRDGDQSTSESRLDEVPEVVVKKSRSRRNVDLDDLPQGLINSDEPPLSPQDEAPAYPTVVAQARKNMFNFQNCVLLTRVGGFYELYFEHADEYGPLLNLKVAQKKTSAGPVSMAGFPFFQLERFLKVLVMDLGKYVAIAEEFPNDPVQKVKAGGLLHDRRVARVVTPGTLIDESFLDGSSNNYVLAIHLNTRKAKNEEADEKEGSLQLGLAWMDLSTGSFYTQATTLDALPMAISRIAPTELVLSKHFETEEHHPLLRALTEDRRTIAYSYADVDEDMGRRYWDMHWAVEVSSESGSKISTEFSNEEIYAGSLLMHYVMENLRSDTMVKMDTPIRYSQNKVLSMDRATLRGLEVKENFRDGTLTGTLLHSLRRTGTSGGGRLLKNWLSAPSVDLAEINGRLDTVERLIAAPELRERARNLLKRCHDSQRLVQKFVLGRGNADDMLALAATINASTLISRAVQAATDDEELVFDPLKQLLRNMGDNSALAARITETIDEEGLQHQHEIEDEEAGVAMALAESAASAQGTAEDIAAVKLGRAGKRPASTTSLRSHYGEDRQIWIMKRNASRELHELHTQLEALEAEKEQLLADLQTQYSANSLTLRWTPGLGHFAHLKGKDVLHPELVAHRSISSSKSTRSIHLPEWTALGTRIDSVRLAIRTEETKVFKKLVSHVLSSLVQLRRNAAAMDELDVYASFAELASEQNLVRPKLNNSRTHHIIGGRHPTVDPSLRIQGRSFISNDLHLPASTAHIITGPNMGGKSTFLRQCALLTIMAQVGSYIPATYAEIGIVDAIYARIGSADNLYRDQSTFMLEMLEVSEILKRATSRSLVIMDEVGRGTSPKSGEAISYATLVHLAEDNLCRTLFATHFHELGGMARRHGTEIEEWCTGITEYEDGFSFSYKLHRGVNKESHALKVAKLAGMPASALARAEKMLRKSDTVAGM